MQTLKDLNKDWFVKTTEIEKRIQEAQERFEETKKKKQKPKKTSHEVLKNEK